MHNRFKHIVFAVLLLILPLQGLAAALTPILCHSDEQQQTAVSVQTHGSDSSSHEEPTSNHDGKAGTGYSGHLCCHHPVGAMPATFAAFADSGPSTYVSLPQVWPSLFSPEQQLRPPRG